MVEIPFRNIFVLQIGLYTFLNKDLYIYFTIDHQKTFPSYMGLLEKDEMITQTHQETEQHPMVSVKIKAQEIKLIQELFRVRMTMLAINENIRQKRFQIPIHLGLGHEAIAVAVSQSKQPQDCLVLSHRNMHYNVANQADANKIFDEYELQHSGLGSGKYGSMNLIHPEQGLVYTSSILGNNLCVASGIAKANQILEKKHQTSPSVTIVVTGDGAMEEGAFYESLLMSKTSKVPMIVIVENNGWSMYTQIHERRFPIDVSGLATSMNIPYHQFSSNDVVEYASQFSQYRLKAIEMNSPVIIEVMIHTLGDYWTEEKANEPSRIINYHHGLAPKIDQIHNVLVEEGISDAAYVAWQKLSNEERVEQQEFLDSCFEQLQSILPESV